MNLLEGDLDEVVRASPNIEEITMRLKTIGLIATLALGLLASPLPVEAQQEARVYRIGFLDFPLRSITTDPRLVALRQGLRELGYVEGQNLVIEYRSAKGKRDRYLAMAEELVRLKADIIVTHSGRWASAVNRAAKKAGRPSALQYRVSGGRCWSSSFTVKTVNS
jgi:ABC-type uncharacterized transport system substrate-binding protein